MKRTGETAPCIGAFVHLLLRPIDLHVVRKKATDDAGVLNPRLAHLYIDYVVSSPATQRKLAYANTRTDDQGVFAFPNLPPDRWYYIIAQALTGQVMISWQLAVHLHEGERVQVFLTNANATLPIYTDSAEQSGADPSSDQ